MPKKTAERHVFVVTYGRSGSTILMKLINAMEGFDLKGENNGAVQHLIESVRFLDIGKERYGGTSTQSVEHPWYGLDQVSLSKHEALVRTAIVEDFIHVEKGKSVGGFKEIRYSQLNDPGFAYHLEFLLGFPNSKIIFLTRDAEQVVKSAWWKDRDRDKTLAMLARMDGLFAQGNKDHPSSTMMFDYSQITQFEEFAKLASFIDGELSEAQHSKICARKINQSS